ncbi:MAG: pilus assembly protein N-terminal domain-containing protein [Schwartzia sp.]|nr:pilus assembly protein N-terminal domain-containing protein [Schwartzia sp. (in: firmicutes)]
MNRWKYGIAALGFAGTAWFSPAAQAAAYIDIDLNGSFLFEGEMPITNIAIANPKVADIVRPSGFNSQVLIVGIAPGSTTLFVWYEDGTMEDYVVNVGIDDTGQARAIERAIGLPGVRVQVVSGEKGKRRVLLRGTVKNQAEHDMAIKIAMLYANSKETDNQSVSTKSSADDITSDAEFEYDFDYQSAKVYENVVDLLTIESPSQIRLEAQLIEIGVDDAKNIGLKYHRTTGMSIDDEKTGFVSVEMGDAGEFTFGESIVGHADNHNWLWRHFSAINASLNLLITEGKAKVLSRPSVSTMSGAKAKIFIGGQIPYPVPTGTGDNITIKWKDYGIRLNIRPTVEDDGTITAEVHAGVSRLDYAHMITTSTASVPSITTREAHSIVHLHEGSTMVIGGLLNSEDTKTVTKVPLLSSIPIIGEFFKHTSTSTDKRELMILITPVIVDDNTPARMSDKMQDYYNKGQEQEKARKDVDLNADHKAEREAAALEEAERARAAREAERNSVEAEWRARDNNVPRVRPGDAWKRVEYPPDEEAAEEAAAAPTDEPEAPPEETVAATEETAATEEPAAPESAEAAAEETQAPPEPPKSIGERLNENRRPAKSKEDREENTRVRKEREAAVKEWRAGESSSAVRPGNGWARVGYPVEKAPAETEPAEEEQ